MKMTKVNGTRKKADKNPLQNFALSVKKVPGANPTTFDFKTATPELCSSKHFSKYLICQILISRLSCFCRC
jgi:hypothetical protein